MVRFKSLNITNISIPVLTSSPFPLTSYFFPLILFHLCNFLCVDFLGDSVVKNLPANEESQLTSLVQEDPLE